MTFVLVIDRYTVVFAIQNPHDYYPIEEMDSVLAVGPGGPGGP
jgi:hypothetical protein